MTEEQLRELEQDYTLGPDGSDARVGDLIAEVRRQTERADHNFRSYERVKEARSLLEIEVARLRRIEEAARAFVRENTVKSMMVDGRMEWYLNVASDEELRAVLGEPDKSEDAQGGAE